VRWNFMCNNGKVMTTIYEELHALTLEGSPIRYPEQAQGAIKAASVPNTPEQFRREMRDATAEMIMPARPINMAFSKDCFWREFQQKFVWHKAWMGTDEQKTSVAKWLRNQRETAQRRGNAYPPQPSFRPIVTMPEPWKGKDEKPGRVPMDGK